MELRGLQTVRQMSGSRILVRNTTERLRTDIDKGRTGDKVAGSDPAAAPLGADDEAAGRPPKAHTVARARLFVYISEK